MKCIWISALALAGLCSASFASPATYSIDPQHSRPRFTYNHFALSSQLGSVNKMTGKITLDADAKAASGDVVIDMNSITSGLDLRDKHMKNATFLDTATYPEATFKSTNVAFAGDRPVSISGNLTMHGISQPVTFNVTTFMRGPRGALQNRDAVGENATAVISRTAFGIDRYAPSVSDDVTITIGLEAIRD
jgi:polyisoprenoid-binding protein YceI